MPKTESIVHVREVAKRQLQIRKLVISFIGGHTTLDVHINCHVILFARQFVSPICSHNNIVTTYLKIPNLIFHRLNKTRNCQLQLMEN